MNFLAMLWGVWYYRRRCNAGDELLAIRAGGETTQMGLTPHPLFGDGLPDRAELYWADEIALGE